jgi:ribonuclease VapC
VIVDTSAIVAIARRRFDDLIREAGIAVEPVTEAHAMPAREAYRDFGKGSGHRAGLNFGYCFSYALSKALRESLLFKGSDFSHTDVTAASLPS